MGFCYVDGAEGARLQNIEFRHVQGLDLSFSTLKIILQQTGQRGGSG